MKLSKKSRLLLLLVLFVVGVFAFLGANVMLELNNSGNYSSVMLSKDIIISVICSLISLSYPFYLVFKMKE